jgi:predicted transcriptional regulator
LIEEKLKNSEIVKELEKETKNLTETKNELEINQIMIQNEIDDLLVKSKTLIRFENQCLRLSEVI